MADEQHISVETFLSDPAAVLDMVENGHITLTLVRDEMPVAVLSPAPVAERMQEIQRTLEAGARDESFYLDVMETRRLLGL